jgi:hypothetical protein
VQPWLFWTLFSFGAPSYWPIVRPYYPVGLVMESVRSVIRACFCLPSSRVPFFLNLLSLNGSRGCLLCSEREASDSSHFLTSFAQNVRTQLWAWIDSLLPGDWKANRQATSRRRKTLEFDIPIAQDWLRAGKRAMCVSVR